MGVIGDELFIAYDRTLQIYDIAGRTWRLGAALPQPRRRTIGVVADGKLFVIDTFPISFNQPLNNWNVSEVTDIGTVCVRRVRHPRLATTQCKIFSVKHTLHGDLSVLPHANAASSRESVEQKESKRVFRAHANLKPCSTEALPGRSERIRTAAVPPVDDTGAARRRL